MNEAQATEAAVDFWWRDLVLPPRDRASRTVVRLCGGAILCCRGVIAPAEPGGTI